MSGIERERSVIHFNVADFAVAVERLSDTSLRHRPLIVAPMQAARAVVYDMSEEAFSCGVRKGMALHHAKRRCREAQIIPPRPDRYQRAMGDFVKRISRFSPLIEYGQGDGHFYVDVTGTHRLFGPPPDIGWKVRREVSRDLGINPIWTVSPNKLVSKVASRLVKPVGEYIVAAGEEEEFLAPLPINLLPGVSPVERLKLHGFNIISIGQLARLSRKELMVPFGRRSDFFFEASRGIDQQMVVGHRPQNAPLGYQHHFADDTNERRQVRAAVVDLACRAGAELRRRKQAARRIGLKLTYSDGTTTIRQASRRMGTASDFALREMAMLALKRAWTRRTRIRSCCLTCDRLHRESPQLSLFSQVAPRQNRPEKVLDAMDKIRHRYSYDLIGMGNGMVAAAESINGCSHGA